MTPDRNSYADIWEMLDGKYAERVRVTDAALVGDEEIVRRWPEIGQGYLSRCMTALKLFTDAKNSTAKSWVENPVCGRETFPGIYRVVTVDVDVQKSGLKGIIQTLRKGWAQIPVWTEARLLEEESGPSNNVSDSGAVPASDNPTRFLKIKFPNCDPGKVEAIASSLGGVSTYSNVVIRGESYSGTWNTVWVATKLEDDGSGTVTLYLALGQYNIKSYDNFGTEREQDIFYVYDCPKNEAQTIIDAWKDKYPVGSSATTNYSRSNGLVDLVLRRRTDTDFEADFGTTGLDCRYMETQTAIFGTANDKAYPIPAVDHDAGVSYTRTVRSNGNGTFDVILTKREVRYRDIDGLVVEQTGESETTQRQQLGLTDEEVEPMEEEPGAIKTQRVEVRDDCSRDVTTNTETGKEQVTTEKTVARSYEEETTETTYQNAELPPPTQETGKIKTVRNTPSKYVGRWNVLEKIRTLLHLPAAVVYDVADDDSVHAQATEDINVPNAGGVAVELTADAGKSLSATVQYNKESDTLDIRKVVEEGKEMASTSEEESAASKTVIEDKTYQDAEITAVPAAGEIVRVDNRKSKYEGKYDTRKSVETGKPQESTTKVEAAGFSETTTEKTVQSSPAPAPTATDGHIRTARTSASKYKDRYDTVETDREVKPLDATASGGGPLWDEVTVVNDNATTDLSGQAAGGLGVIIDTASKKNDAGRFDNRKTTRTAKPCGPVTSVHGSPLVEETVERSRNQDSMPSPGTPADGTMVDVSGSINDAAKIDVTKTTRRAIEKQATADSGGPLISVSETIKVNSPSPANPGAGADGTINDVSNTINEFGRYNVSQTVKTANPKEATSTSGGPLVTVTETVKVNATAPESPGAGSTGTIINVSNSINAFGRYDVRKTTKTAKVGQDSGWVPYTDRYGTSYVRSFQNMQSVPTDGFTDKTSNSLSFRKNEFGLFDGSASRTAVKGGGGSSPDPDVEISYNITIAGVAYTISEKITSSLTSAQSHVSGNNTGGSGKTPGIVYIGKGKYKATKVTA
jgi:hypothetical protein